MKFFYTSLFIFALFIGKAQTQTTEENRFQQSENVATGTTQGNENSTSGLGDTNKGPGNPPGDDEIPIDGYLPILAILGSSLIVYKYRYKILNSN